MPRLTISTPKYRKHRASGQAIVSINGCRHYLGPHGTKASRLEYDRLITEWLSSGRSPSYGVPEHVVTVLELIVLYLEHAKEYYGSQSRSETQNLLYALRPLKQLYARHPVAGFTPQHLKAVRLKMIELGWSRKHINANVHRIRRVFRWGVSEGMVPAEVLTALEAVDGLHKGKTKARETGKVLPVLESIVTATLPYLSTVVRAMAEIQLATGMRPGELCIMRPCDIDRRGAVWEYVPEHHKNENREQERIVYIGPKGQQILAPFMLRDAESHCFNPAEAVQEMHSLRNTNRKTPASCGNTIGSNRQRRPRRKAGERYTTQSYASAIRRACVKAFPAPEGIAKDANALRTWRARFYWAPNRLRHSAATKIRSEHDLDAARILLGHKKSSTTEIYAAKDRKKAIRVAEQFG